MCWCPWNITFLNTIHFPCVIKRQTCVTVMNVMMWAEPTVISATRQLQISNGSKRVSHCIAGRDELHWHAIGFFCQTPALLWVMPGHGLFFSLYLSIIDYLDVWLTLKMFKAGWHWQNALCIPYLVYRTSCKLVGCRQQINKTVLEEL